MLKYLIILLIISGNLYAKEQVSDSNLMIFISSSIPKESLKNYYIEAKKYNGILLIRGFVNNSLKDTVSYFKKAGEEGVRVSIDPASFKKYNITAVPVIIIKDSNSDSNSYHKITGNVTVNYALQQIN